MAVDGSATVVGAPGERVSLACWSADRGPFTEVLEIPGSGGATVVVRR